ncbi:disease resistance protein RPM1-like [Panicum miliaceum]|uniref:Disease resistance protein RPM1-like n=1 Tax=Panicum miliaceum TaxID=4540 RepID=A0A3L6RNN9_PANMI|nr:disease resistance protein RPM1-like [Panicum miliaceum]
MEATAVSVGKAVLDGALGYAKSIVAEEIALQLGIERDVIFIGDELEMMRSFLLTADEEHDKHKVLLTWVNQKKPFCWCIPRNLWERRSIAKEVKELRTRVEDVSNRNLRYRLIKGSSSTNAAVEVQGSVSSASLFQINEARWAAQEQETLKMSLHQLITRDDKDLRVFAVWGTGYNVLKELEKMERSHIVDQVSAHVNEKRYLVVIEGLSTIVEWDCIKTYFPDKKNGSRIIVSTQHVEIGSLCTEQPYQVTELKQLSPNHSIYLFHNRVEPRSRNAMSIDGINSTMQSSSSEIQEDAQQIGEGGDSIESKLDRSKTMVISVWGMGGVGKTSLVQSVYRSQELGSLKHAWVTAVRPFNYESIIRNLVWQLQKDIQEDPAEAKWNLIKEHLAKATRIIVTTREKYVAKYCSREDMNIYGLQRLEYAAAFDLFKRKVFKDSSEKIELSPDMMEQARLILKKCNGLPLAISTIGAFLATRHKSSIEWRKTNDRISTELEINPELRTIKTVLVRSYDGLPYHLKSCFLYLSIFPEDYNIRRKRVIRRWDAEGYLREMHGMTAAEVGDEYFDGLLDRSMILQGAKVIISGSKVDSCQLHDIMRHICISKAREENLIFTLDEGCILGKMTGAIRHLVISSSWKRDKDMFQRWLDLSYVRSLTVFGEWKSFFLYSKMKFLRVLDFEDTSGLQNHHLDKIMELIHLKYLSLRRCKSISKLPNSLGNLSHLETLDVRGTLILKFPTTITKLWKLQHLLAVHADPSGKLKALRTLCDVYVNDTNLSATLMELKQLTQLRKLRLVCCTRNEKAGEKLWSAIDGHMHLQSFSLKFYGCNLESQLGGTLSPPKSIDSLKLCARLVQVSQWIHKLQNLSKLQLRGTDLNQDGIHALGKLPNLAVLQMWWNSVQQKQLQFIQFFFPSLILLDLRDLHELEYVKFEDGTMPKLELLQVSGKWSKLQEFSGLQYLMKLKEIHVNGEFRLTMDNVENLLVDCPNHVSLKLMETKS